MKTFTANGKLLLTGEYFVLDGALALAIPTRYGQTMSVGSGDSDMLHWQSFAHDNRCWFRGSWRYSTTQQQLEIVEASDAELAARLTQLFATALALGARAEQLLGHRISTHLNFPRQWGLGSSSTLISLLAEWLRLDPYQLLGPTFGGSGYDLACARTQQPIFYRRVAGQPQAVPIPWHPAYAEWIHFVYLGSKQNSREGIAHYRSRKPQPELTEQVSRLSFAFAAADTATAASAILQEHEKLVAEALDLPRLQSRYFADFPGLVKSLGAWGGDFAMAIQRPETSLDPLAYFNERGYSTVIPFVEMIL